MPLFEVTVHPYIRISFQINHLMTKKFTAVAIGIVMLIAPACKKENDAPTYNAVGFWRGNAYLIHAGVLVNPNGATARIYFGIPSISAFPAWILPMQYIKDPGLALFPATFLKRMGLLLPMIPFSWKPQWNLMSKCRALCIPAIIHR
jgi:hypothetical protein